LSAYVFSESSQEEKWVSQVTAALREKADYRLVSVSYGVYTIQQTSSISTCILNTFKFAGRLLDRVNTPLSSY